jgi:hypothetical protein
MECFEFNFFGAPHQTAPKIVYGHTQIFRIITETDMCVFGRLLTSQAQKIREENLGYKKSEEPTVKNEHLKIK